MSEENGFPTIGNALFEQIKGTWEYEFMVGTVRRLLKDQTKRERALGLLERNWSHLLTILELPELERLTRVSQFGIKTCRGKRTNKKYSRYHHSISVGTHALSYAVAIGLDDNACLAMCALGLWHDVGHFAFSHDIESLIRKRIGFDHEQNTFRLFAKSRRFRVTLARAGALEAVEMAMRGLGSFPMLLSLADTIAYLHDDSIVLGRNIDESIGAQIASSLQGVHDWGYIADYRPFHLALESRAEVYSDFYVSEENQVMQATLTELAKMTTYLWPNYLRMCVDATDDEALAHIRSMLKTTSHPWPMVLNSILTQGTTRIEDLICVTLPSDSRQRLDALHTLGYQYLYIRPCDFRKKVYRVRTGAITYALRADPDHLARYHREHRAYVYIGR